MTGAPMLKATGLWRRTSAKGADYFAGRLGQVKIVILENWDRQAETDPTHWLYFAEPTAAASSSAQSRNGARTPRAARRSPYSKLHQPAGPVASAPMPDDPLADLWARPVQ
jgi:hypothetical protein